MALQLSGTSKQELERLWAVPSRPIGRILAQQRRPATTRRRPGSNGDAPLRSSTTIGSSHLRLANRRPPLAIATGLSIEGGLSRVCRVRPTSFLTGSPESTRKPWVMVPGGSAEAQFDVVPDAWYFSADRQDRMPFAVLLEVALQACGWMAAYMGSALTSDGDLKFRNLGGTGRQHLPVTRDTGTLTTRFRVTKISSMAGMILQHYEFAVSCRRWTGLRRQRGIRLLRSPRLEQQVGIRELVPYTLNAGELAAAESFVFPAAAPFPDSRWRMIDRVDALVMQGGAAWPGRHSGQAHVSIRRPGFFRPISSTIRSGRDRWDWNRFLQLLKIVAAKRWGAGPSTVFESPVIGQSHGWTYRGQIIPTNQNVGVQAEIKAVR